ncbi:MAG TPA: Xaa-Pro peptidase family protein [Methanothrix soehngenii]|nr:Xaa-Pro peptidase family protein [Methanotrichaceae archaeon]HQF16447.1 Xaa-Pro peptidase family protein [Methanotrichaceae archaeon]HQI53800.1 Xaa-Pro peptidase family protein [Methanothrix soehngenii]HQI91205.1 Xaa-Pro peptidase family protein [Methanotrichaceae archaeon]HQJ28427.1 Xaa-Pro peptidase family protein [Methanotrichaceae archaeon]
MMIRMEYVLHPRSEIDKRTLALQSRMGETDGALLFNSVDMCYFSGTAQDGLVYIPKEGGATVMIKRSLERAQQESPLEVRPLRSLKNLKSDLDIADGARIGLEWDVLPMGIYERVSRSLAEAAFFDISEEIRQVRSVKSDFEIGLIREAARILDCGISAVPEYLKEGMTEVDLACRLESVMRSMGHQGSLRFRRFNSIVPLGHIMSGPDAAAPSFLASPTGGRGTSLLFPQGAGYGKIRRNEPVFVDMAGIYNGYIADSTRIFCMGNLPRVLEDAYSTTLDILDEVAACLKPGANGMDLYRRSEEEGALRGYKDHLGGTPGNKCGFVGHGVGLELDEYPVLGPLDHIIKEGMTIAVEPKMIYPHLGVVGVEDTFLTTGSGPERLTRLPREIWRL